MLKIIVKMRNEISKLNTLKAKTKFEECAELIEKYHEKFFPSQEIVLLQECLLQYVTAIIKPKLLMQ